MPFVEVPPSPEVGSHHAVSAGDTTARRQTTLSSVAADRHGTRVIDDVLLEYLRNGPRWLPVFAALSLTALGALWLDRAIRGRPGAGRAWHRSLVVVAVLLGLGLASTRLWLCDDAFISFRYARNFADGRGLVFNPGEWVEGYTNFLWTLGLGILGWLGADIPTAALFGNLLAFAAALVLTADIARRAGPDPGGAPLATLAVAASSAFAIYASSGLETMPAIALVLGAVRLSMAPGRELWSGALMIAAALMRPDHLLFWGCLGLALAVEDATSGPGWSVRRLRWRRRSWGVRTEHPQQGP